MKWQISHLNWVFYLLIKNIAFVQNYWQTFKNIQRLLMVSQSVKLKKLQISDTSRLGLLKMCYFLCCHIIVLWFGQSEICKELQDVVKMSSTYNKEPSCISWKLMRFFGSLQRQPPGGCSTLFKSKYSERPVKLCLFLLTFPPSIVE